MTPTESITSALECNWQMVDSALDGLDEATLSQRPNAQCNSIAWILWHMNRVVDTLINPQLRDRSPLWISDGWYHRYGMDDRKEDTRPNRGVGWTAEEVAAWVAPPREVQLGYYEAVKAVAREYLPNLSQADLQSQMVFPPVAEPRTVAAILGQVTWDNIAHGGQIAYLRGLHLGMGWHR